MRLFRNPARFAGIVLVSAALIVYLLTLDNGLQPYELRGGDLITHHYAQVQARFANAPGYPLYSMGGWLWFHGWYFLLTIFGGPDPNPIPLLSSYSTLWAIPALWMLYQLIRRYTITRRHPQGNWPVASLITAFFGVTYFFWYYATTSEQYSSAVAQTLAILLIYGTWQTATQRQQALRHATPTSPKRVPGDNKWLYLLAFLCGLSLAHMLTVAFIVPPLVAVMLVQAPGLLGAPRAVGGAVVAAAAPLLSYFFVYIRGAQYPEWRGEGAWQSTSAWFWSFVGTDQGRDELSWGLQPGAPFFGNGFPELMWQELSLPLLLAGLVGIAFLPRRIMWILYPTLLIYMGFCWAYRLGNWFQVILPAYPLILLGAAVLVDRLEAFAAMRLPQTTPRLPWPQLTLLALLATGLIWRVDASLPAANSRNRAEDTGLVRAAILLDAPLPTGVSLFAPVDDALALQYLTQVWRLRPDLQLVSSNQAAAHAAAGIPLAATWNAAELLLSEMGPPDAINTVPVAATSSTNETAVWHVHPLNPDWMLILHPAHSARLFPSSQQFAYRTTDLAMHENIVLQGLEFTTPRLGAPVTDSQLAVDITLYWSLALESEEARAPGVASAPAWDSNLRLSVRPLGTSGYLPGNLAHSTNPDEEFAKIDRSMPAPLLYSELSDTAIPLAILSSGQNITQSTEGISAAAGRKLIVDPYRFWIAPHALPALTGVEIILYRLLTDGFENVATVRLDPDGQILP